jgi:hypothetical protein
MRLFISMAAALALCVCALVACSPQDGSTPAARREAANGSPTPAANGNATPAADGNPTVQTAQHTEAQHEDGTRRISIEESQKAVEAGTALIVDVRDEASYKGSHIKGAKSIPLQQFDKRMNELPKDKLIITYCA